MWQSNVPQHAVISRVLHPLFCGVGDISYPSLGCHTYRIDSFVMVDSPLLDDSTTMYMLLIDGSEMLVLLLFFFKTLEESKQVVTIVDGQDAHSRSV